MYVDAVSVANNTFVMSNAGYHFYIATNLNGGTLTNPVCPLTIGNEPPTSPSGVNAYPWVGDIIKIMLYNRVITPSEMQQLFDQFRKKYGL